MKHNLRSRRVLPFSTRRFVRSTLKTQIPVRPGVKMSSKPSERSPVPFGEAQIRDRVARRLLSLDVELLLILEIVAITLNRAQG